METLVVDLVPYELKHELVNGEDTYSLPNFLGTDCLRSLERSNPWGYAAGVVPGTATVVSVTAEAITFVCESSEVVPAMDYILNAYPTVGWECLTK